MRDGATAKAASFFDRRIRALGVDATIEEIILPAMTLPLDYFRRLSYSDVVRVCQNVRKCSEKNCLVGESIDSTMPNIMTSMDFPSLGFLAQRLLYQNGKR